MVVADDPRLSAPVDQGRAGAFGLWLLAALILIQFFTIPALPGVNLAPENFVFLAAILAFGPKLARLAFASLVGLEDLDLEVLENGEDVIDFLLVLDGLRQRLVDVVEREVTLLLRKTDQMPNLVVDATGGNVTGRALRDGHLLVFGDDGLDGFGMGVGGCGLGFTRHRCGRSLQIEKLRRRQLERLAQLALNVGAFL